MAAYLARRALLSIPTLFLVSLAVFLLLRVAPGGPVETLLGEEWGDSELARELERDLGLDLPLWRQYLAWLGKALRGDLGRSIVMYRGDRVSPLILRRIAVTAELAGLALAVALTIAVPLGVISAVKHNRALDHLARVAAMAGMSVPNFFLGVALIALFGLAFHRPWGVGGYVPISSGLGENLLHLILPAVVLGTAHAAVIMRMTRAAMLEALSREFARTARAMGLPERRVLVPYVLKNALIPVLTVVGNAAGALLDGAVITESVFRIPGLGSLMVGGVLARDFPVVQALVVVAVAIRIAVNLAVDILYGAVDPRIRYAEE